MNKLGVTLDLNEKSEVDELRRLAVRSDVVSDHLASGYLDGLGLGYQAFKEEKPGIVYTSITTFGSWGPYADYKLTDLVLFHMSGPDWASEDRFTSREGREANFPELWSLVEGWTRTILSRTGTTGSGSAAYAAFPSTPSKTSSTTSTCVIEGSSSSRPTLLPGS